MSAFDNQPLPQHLPESEAKRILDRALEIDHATGPLMSMDNLRDVALELGISDSALNRALRERLLPAVDSTRHVALVAAPYSTAVAPGPLARWWGWHRERWSKGLQTITRWILPAGLLSGALIGIMVDSPMMNRGGGSLFALVATVCGVVVATRPRKATMAQMLAILGLFWAGILVGSFATTSGVGDREDVATATVVYFLFSAATGIVLSAIAALVRHLSAEDSAPQGGSPTLPIPV